MAVGNLKASSIRISQNLFSVAKVRKAQIATKVLFETGLQNVHANDIISALEGDPRLVFVEMSEILEKPLDLLASVYGLLPSRSEFFFARRGVVRWECGFTFRENAVGAVCFVRFIARSAALGSDLRLGGYCDERRDTSS